MTDFFQSNGPSSTAEFMQELSSLKRANYRAKIIHGEEALDRYLIAKSAKIGAHIHCPACGTPFTKTKTVKIFCKRECSTFFGRHYVGKPKFRSRIEQGRAAGKLLQMTREQLIQHLEDTKAIPLYGIYHCVYCDRMGVKKRGDQCYCVSKLAKCKERFRLLIRENSPEPLDLQPSSASLSVMNGEPV